MRKYYTSYAAFERDSTAQATRASAVPVLLYDNERWTKTPPEEQQFLDRVTFFANLRNLNDVPEIFEIAGPNTPAMARQNDHVSYGALWTFGFKGKL